MRYDEVRHLIEDGDLIAVHGKSGLLTPFTRFFTDSNVTHTGIAIWLDGGLWLAELNGGGNHMVPMSQIMDGFDAFYSPVDDRQAVRHAVLESQRNKIHYGAFALLVIGLLNWLRIKMFLHARRILVCSGYCVKVYEAAGWPEHSYLISPAELAGMLKPKLEVRNARL
jgi:hypothetical protein